MEIRQSYDRLVSITGFPILVRRHIHVECTSVNRVIHYNDVIMGAMASQITSLTIVYSTLYSDANETKHQSSASLAFVRGIHRSPVNSPHKWPVTRKMFPFDDVIIIVRNHNGLGLNHSISRCHRAGTGNPICGDNTFVRSSYFHQ